MTSKPTARERFEQISSGQLRRIYPSNDINFLISLVEAAVSIATRYSQDSKVMQAGDDIRVPVWAYLSDNVWQEIDQRMAEGESK